MSEINAKHPALYVSIHF